MRIKLNWLRVAYFYLYAVAVMNGAVEFLRPDTDIYRYYHFLIGFSPCFLVPYLLNLLSVFVNILSLLPFYSYIDKSASVSRPFSAFLLLTRIALDLFGRSYWFRTIQATSYHNRHTAVVLLVFAALFVFPSYWAHFRYTFRPRDRR